LPQRQTRRETLCRYILRPPAGQRPATHPARRKRKLEFKRPWSDGTTRLNFHRRPHRAARGPGSLRGGIPPDILGPFFTRNFAQRSRACSRHASTGPASKTAKRRSRYIGGLALRRCSGSRFCARSARPAPLIALIKTEDIAKRSEPRCTAGGHP